MARIDASPQIDPRPPPVVEVVDDAGLLRISVSSTRQVLIVALSGDADLSTEPAMRGALDRVVKNAEGPVVLDVSGLEFCDVRGATVLLVAHAEGARRGLPVVLAGMSVPLSRLWQIAFGDDRPGALLPATYATRAAAVDALRPAAEHDDGDAETAREQARLAAVRRYDVLDTPPDGAFDRITALAARIFGVPIAIVSIVDADRIWFKSHHGLVADQIGRDPGLCASAIVGGEPWLVTDAAIDVRTMANPLVAGEMGLRFYFGVPLTTGDGHNLGTLCVIDRKPRDVTQDEVATLTDLASLVMDELELRLAAQRVVGMEDTLRDRVRGLSRALQASVLPANLPQVPGLEITARYHVANHDFFGGDFYDVIASEYGYAAISGDVAGKGTEASARAAAHRWTLRALTAGPWAPGETLARLNALFARWNEDPEQSCTIALASIRPSADDGGFDVAVSLAGHPQPLLLRPDGAVGGIGRSGSAIGWVGGATYAEASARLAPGDCLVMFTDGLLEAIGGHASTDDTAIRDLLQPLGGAPASVVADRLEAVVGTALLRDDAAFLVIRAA